MASSRSGRRIVALWFPRLSTDRLQRRWKAQAKDAPPRSDVGAPPLVVVAKQGNALRLSAVDRKAAALGLHHGMALADARAMLPALKAVAENEPAGRALLEAMADWCLRFTPFVAADFPRTLLLDVTGAAHLLGGEEAMLKHILSSFSLQGFAVRGALAGTAAAACALVRHRNGVVVPPGEEESAVAPLPVEALRLDAGVIHALRRTGLKMVGQVAARRRSELTARFGREMVALLDCALGKDERPISPRTPLPDFSAEHRFAEPVVTEDAILRTLRNLSQTLAAVLNEQGKGARRMEAFFFRADGQMRRIAVETGEPTRDPALIERLFKERIDALADPLDPGFGYDLIRLCAARVELAQIQALHFESAVNDEKELRFLIDRLAARFGPQRVLSFIPNDTHIPEAAWAAVPAQYAAEYERPWEAMRETKEAPRRPLRLFAKPERVEVVAAVPESPPAKFRWRRAWHRVAHAEGPERIAMEWWRRQTHEPTRDYFRVEDEEGRRYWLYRDGIQGRETLDPHWYIHGVFA